MEDDFNDHPEKNTNVPTNSQYSNLQKRLYAKHTISMLVIETKSETDDNKQFLKYLWWISKRRMGYYTYYYRFNIWLCVLSWNGNMVSDIINSLIVFRYFHQIKNIIA